MCAGFATRPATARAELLYRVLERPFAAARGFLERQRDLLANVTALRELDAHRAEQITKDIVQANEVSQIQIGEVEGDIGAARPKPPWTKRSRTEAIEGSAFLRITQYLVGGVEIGEALLSRRIPRVSVGMVLGREPSECTADLGFIRITSNAEKVVRVLHSCRRVSTNAFSTLVPDRMPSQGVGRRA